MSSDTENKEESLVDRLAQRLREDKMGQVLADYDSAFGNSITQTQRRLREPLAPDEYLLNKTILETAELARQIIAQYWKQCHKR